MATQRQLYRKLGVVFFRVYPRRSCRGLYVEVRVFRTAGEMRTALRLEALAYGKRENYRKAQGAMQSFTVIKRGRLTSKIFGRVNLHRGKLGVAVVSHEFNHAAFAWADRVGLFQDLVSGKEKRTMPTEERFCHAQDEMLRQFVQRAYDIGLYPG